MVGGPLGQRLLVLESSWGHEPPIGVSEMYEKVGDRRAVYEIRSLIPDIHGVCPGLVQRRSVRIRARSTSHELRGKYGDILFVCECVCVCVAHYDRDGRSGVG